MGNWKERENFFFALAPVSTKYFNRLTRESHFRQTLNSTNMLNDDRKGNNSQKYVCVCCTQKANSCFEL